VSVTSKHKGKCGKHPITTEANLNFAANICSNVHHEKWASESVLGKHSVFLSSCYILE